MNSKSVMNVWHFICRWATNFKVIFCVWLLMPTFVFLKTLAHEPDNTFNIFRYVYIHTVNMVSLYGEHLAEYSDENHYGPFFAIFVAPFAVLPMWVGYAFWLVAMVMLLYAAVRTSSLTRKQQVFILLFTAAEMLNCIFQAQFNGVIAALLIFAFYMCSLSPGDLCPAYLRNTYIIPYSLKALPISIIWFKLCYEMMTKNYSEIHTS